METHALLPEATAAEYLWVTSGPSLYPEAQVETYEAAGRKTFPDRQEEQATEGVQ